MAFLDNAGLAYFWSKIEAAITSKTPAWNDITGKPAWVDSATKPTYNASEVGAIPTTEKGANSGVATLNTTGKVPMTQITTDANGGVPILDTYTKLAMKYFDTNGANKLLALNASGKVSTSFLETNVAAGVLGLDSNGKVDTLKLYTNTSGGVPMLDANGKVSAAQLPSYVDDVIEGYYKVADGKFYEESSYTTEIEGVSGIIYIDLGSSNNECYRYSGSVYIKISDVTAITNAEIDAIVS